MEIKLFIGPKKLKVSPILPIDLYRELREEFTYRVKDYERTNAYRLYGWDGRKCLFFKDQTISSGCYIKLKNILEKKGHKVNIFFENDYTPNGSGKVHTLTLDKFQLDAIKSSVDTRYGIISAPVRSGKTAMMSGIISTVGHYPVWVITNGNDLVLQTRKDIKTHLKLDIGAFSESEFMPKDITVSSYQALNAVFSERRQSGDIKERNKEIIASMRKAKVLLLDECHHALSAKAQKFISEFSNIGYKIGLSGTPKSDKKSKLELESGIGPIVMLVRYKTLINAGRLAQPIIAIYNLPYAWFSNYLVDYPDIYTSNIVENNFRNRLIAEFVKKMERLGKTTFIMIRRKAHGPILKSFIPKSVYIHGGIDSKIRKQLYQALQKKKISCIIATVGKEGLNLPRLDVVINAEGLASSVATVQKMRSLTACKNKKYGIVIDFLDKGRYLKDHSEIRIKQYTKLFGDAVRLKNVPKSHFSMEESRWLNTTT